MTNIMLSGDRGLCGSRDGRSPVYFVVVGLAKIAVIAKDLKVRTLKFQLRIFGPRFDVVNVNSDAMSSCTPAQHATATMFLEHLVAQGSPFVGPVETGAVPIRARLRLRRPAPRRPGVALCVRCWRRRLGGEHANKRLNRGPCFNLSAPHFADMRPHGGMVLPNQGSHFGVPHIGACKHSLGAESSRSYLDQPVHLSELAH